MHESKYNPLEKASKWWLKTVTSCILIGLPIMIMVFFIGMSYGTETKVDCVHEIYPPIETSIEFTVENVAEAFLAFEETIFSHLPRSPGVITFGISKDAEVFTVIFE